MYYEGQIVVPDSVEWETVEVRKKAQERLKKMPVWKAILPAKRKNFESDGEYFEFLLAQQKLRREVALKILKKSLWISWKMAWFLFKTTAKLAFIFVVAIFSRKAAKFALTRLLVRMV